MVSTGAAQVHVFAEGVIAEIETGDAGSVRKIFVQGNDKQDSAHVSIAGYTQIFCLMAVLAKGQATKYARTTDGLFPDTSRPKPGFCLCFYETYGRKKQVEKTFCGLQCLSHMQANML